MAWWNFQVRRRVDEIDPRLRLLGYIEINMQTLMVLAVNEEKYEYRRAARSVEDEMDTVSPELPFVPGMLVFNVHLVHAMPRDGAVC
jgi:hypothetical protein